MLFKLVSIVVLLISVGIGYLGYIFLKDLQLSEIQLIDNQYWGPGSPKIDDPKVYPFKINVTKSVIQDLETRLKLELSAGRFTEPLENSGFHYGSNTKFVQSVVQHWAGKYDWRSREAELNKYPSFRTKISGLNIHFQHVKQSKKDEKTRALLLIHGWPGSFVEYQKIIPIILAAKESKVKFEVS